MIVEMLESSFFQRALLAGLLASIACGLIGTFVVVKRMSSVSGGIAHASLGGVGLGYYFGFDPLVGAVGVAIASAVVIGMAYIRQHESLDTLIAMVWSFGMAIGVVLIGLTPGYAPDLSGYLFGCIVFVREDYLLIVALLDVVLLFFLFTRFRYFQAVAFDEEFSDVRGVPVEGTLLLLLILTSLAVVTLIKVVGVILLIALLTIPSVIARMWSENLVRMMVMSIVLSMFCAASGLCISYWMSFAYSLNVPSGPLIILVSLACYLLSGVLRKALGK